MTMVVDNPYRHTGGVGYDGAMYSSAPHFTDPWAHAPPPQTSSLYSTTLGSNAIGVNAVAKQETQRPTNITLPYSSVPVSAPSIVADGLTRHTYDHSYPSSTAPHSYATTAPYNPLNYAQSMHQQQQQQQTGGTRRISQAGTATSRTSDPTFGDALDAGRGMVAMSQTDLTPRNIYGRGSRDSADSYGFPATHSSSSSISSASNYPYFASSVAPSVAGSVDSSVTDYSSTTSESYEPMQSRTLPRPNLYGSGLPPAPQSMMGQFSSKMSSNTQKKHKCKVCDKRFTRPSSLQTHMYSHTGEKPYACDVEGCGRHFSVVSNLRRHKKVHKGEHDPSSPDED